MAEPHRTLAAYLSQRRELLGEGRVYLDELEGSGVLRRARKAASGAPTGATPAPPGGPEQPAGEGTMDRSIPAGPASSSTVDTDISLQQALGGSYEELRTAALACTRCRLAEGRTQVVFSDGNPNGRLMVVGEAPGANEDATGLPFVGQAGKLLDLMLASVDLSRKDTVYIGNVLKCRPPGNRNPLPDEIDACAPLLRRQIELVSPEVILAVGSFAAQWLTGTHSALGKLRGSVYAYQGVPLVVTYHPAALLRNPGWSRAAWDDLQLLRQILDGD